MAKTIGTKPQPREIGAIGQNKIVLYGETPMIVIGKTWLSAGKIKSVLANDAACRALLAQYDKPKPASEEPKKVDIRDTAEFKAALAAQLAKFNNTGRIDPMAAH